MTTNLKQMRGPSVNPQSQPVHYEPMPLNLQMKWNFLLKIFIILSEEVPEFRGMMKIWERKNA